MFTDNFVQTMGDMDSYTTQIERLTLQKDHEHEALQIRLDRKILYFQQFEARTIQLEQEVRDIVEEQIAVVEKYKLEVERLREEDRKHKLELQRLSTKIGEKLETKIVTGPPDTPQVGCFVDHKPKIETHLVSNCPIFISEMTPSQRVLLLRIQGHFDRTTVD